MALAKTLDMHTQGFKIQIGTWDFSHTLRSIKHLFKPGPMQGAGSYEPFAGVLTLNSD